MKQVTAGLAVAAALALSGCALGPNPKHVAYLNTLVGKSETDLVRAMGVPSRSFDSGGHKFLAYSRTKLESTPGDPGFGPGWGWGYPGWHGGWGGWGGFPPQIIQRDCETTFDLLNGTVQAYNLRGNDC